MPMLMAFYNKDQPTATAGGSDTPTIHFALTHDWELRGDGSGDIEQIQFAPLRKLLEIYRKHHVRTTFLPDLMQQIRFRQLESEYPELKSSADKWDEHVREAFRQGHDVQLHLHPQWRDGRYENGRWHLNGDWSILNYDRDAAYAMLAAGKDYLEKLLRPIDSSYRCLAFRAGALAAAPSDHLFKSLVFYGSRRAVTRQNVALIHQQLRRPAKASRIREQFESKSRIGLVFEKIIVPAIKRKHFVSDMSRLSYPLMREMLASTRQRARQSGLSQVPVVLTNHPKDIRDVAAIERFVGKASRAKDITFATLTEMAGKLESGEFRVRMSDKL